MEKTSVKGTILLALLFLAIPSYAAQIRAYPWTIMKVEHELTGAIESAVSLAVLMNRNRSVTKSCPDSACYNEDWLADCPGGTVYSKTISDDPVDPIVISILSCAGTSTSQSPFWFPALTPAPPPTYGF